MFLTIRLSPLVRVMNALSYANGMTQLQLHLGQFGRRETRGQLTFASRLGLMANPAVYARGMLAMTRHDAADVLVGMPVPSLVIAADRDQATVPAASHLMARRLPGAAEMTLMQSGHMGLIEHHQQWARAVGAFADRCFGGPAPAGHAASDGR